MGDRAGREKEGKREGGRKEEESSQCCEPKTKEKELHVDTHSCTHTCNHTSILAGLSLTFSVFMFTVSSRQQRFKSMHTQDSNTDMVTHSFPFTHIPTP
jgi:hypothetical protein